MVKNDFVDILKNSEGIKGFQNLTPAKQWKKLEPRRPKRPLSGYPEFVSDFAKKKGKKAKMEGGPELMRNAAAAWNNLDDDKKDEWKEVDDEQTKAYQEKMEEYYRVKNAMKKPPSSYALFVKDTWDDEQKKMSTQRRKADFFKVRAALAKRWSKLSKRGRKPYEEKAANLRKLFGEERDAVLSGARELNLNWRGEEEIDEEEDEEVEESEEEAEEDDEEDEDGDEDFDNDEGDD